MNGSAEGAPSAFHNLFSLSALYHNKAQTACRMAPAAQLQRTRSELGISLNVRRAEIFQELGEKGQCS